MQNKYIYILIGLVLITSFVSYVVSQNAVILNSSDTITSTAKGVYINEKYGYRVSVGTLSGELLVDDIYKNESDGLDVSHGADYKSFQTRENLALIGTIFCADTIHFQDGLSNEMSLQEYSETLHDKQLAEQLLAESYDEVISVVDLHESSLAEKTAYSYAIGFKRGLNTDINVYTVAENLNGKKCVLNYPVFDYKDKQNSEILEMRLQWINSV